MEKWVTNLRVSGNKEYLGEFLLFCKKLEYLCNVGLSREIKLYVNGDGSADLNFDFGSIEFGDEQEFKEEMEKETSSNKPIEIYIGE
ncbi:MAG: hypothetical protein ACOC1K_01355 [Nanoarchaeota archaeon]